MTTDHPAWRIRSQANVYDYEEDRFLGLCRIGINYEELDLHLNGETGEAAMKRALAKIYQASEFNILRERIDVLAYRLTDQCERADPELRLWDILYKAGPAGSLRRKRA
ncbi:hypothetical protein [Nonomuraea dietziae]|uniref:hypothetical protein n=1 Tax=Nonomuraea dietziae TaxID=65515 RepID=UPI0033CD9D83